MRQMTTKIQTDATELKRAIAAITPFAVKKPAEYDIVKFSIKEGTLALTAGSKTAAAKYRVHPAKYAGLERDAEFTVSAQALKKVLYIDPTDDREEEDEAQINLQIEIDDRIISFEDKTGTAKNASMIKIARLENSQLEFEEVVKKALQEIGKEFGNYVAYSVDQLAAIYKAAKAVGVEHVTPIPLSPNRHQARVFTEFGSFSAYTYVPLSVKSGDEEKLEVVEYIPPAVAV